MSVWALAVRWPLLRQLVSFGMVGVVLVLLDWAVFVALSALGVATVPANLAGRICGACAGFWLNGAITFRRAGRPVLGRGPMQRFALLWCTLTLLSSGAMLAIESLVSLRSAWLAKPLVETVLAVLSFMVARHWVYR